MQFINIDICITFRKLAKSNVLIPSSKSCDSKFLNKAICNILIGRRRDTSVCKHINIQQLISLDSIFFSFH